MGVSERGVKSKRHIIETTGSGAAFIDYNNDGLLDIFLISGSGGTNRVYRNMGKIAAESILKE